MKIQHFLILGSLLIASHGEAQTFPSTDTPLPIPDNNATGITSTINVGTSGSLLDANVLVNINHTFVGDLIVRITSPGGTSVDLFNRLSADIINFGDGEDLIGSYLFDDSAAMGLPQSPGVAGPPIPPGTYLPLEALAAFIGEETAGIWTLFVSDNGAADTGTLNFWQLILEIQPTAAAKTEAPKPFVIVDIPALAEPARGNVVFQTARSTTRQASQLAQQEIAKDADSLRRAIDIGGPGSGGSFESAQTGSLSHFLTFMGDNGVHPRVALGLAEGKEKQVPSSHSTLDSQGAIGSSMPMMMLGGLNVAAATAEPVAIVVPANESGDGKEPVSEKVVIDDDGHSWRWRVFTGGAFDRYHQNQLTDLIQPFQTDSWSGSIGGEYVVIPHRLAAGLGYGYTTSDTKLGGNLGSIDADGHVLTTFVRTTWDGFYSNLYYSYGTFDNDIHRNTGWGERTTGNPDSQSHSIFWKNGIVFQPTERLATGPYLELNYAQGSLDGYTERGSVRGNLAFEGTDYESLQSGLGWAAEYRLPTAAGDLDLQVHVAWEREFMPEDGATSSQLVNSPFVLVNGNRGTRFGEYGATTGGAHPGTDWLGFGVNGRLHLSQKWQLNLGYDAQLFRENASAHFVSAFLSREF